MRYEDIVRGPYLAKGRNGETETIEDIFEFSRRHFRFLSLHCYLPHGNFNLIYSGSRRRSAIYCASSDENWVMPGGESYAYLARWSAYGPMASAAAYAANKAREAKKQTINGLIVEPSTHYFRIEHATHQDLLETRDAQLLVRMCYVSGRDWCGIDPVRWVKREDHSRANPRPSRGSKKSRYRCFLSHMRTTAEIRANAGHRLEYGQSIVRGRRSPSVLPTVWDDHYRHSSRSWKDKKCRKQWQKNLKP